MSDACSYATIDDFDIAGVPPAALANVSLVAKQAALMRASRMADTFLRDRYSLPLKCPFDPTLTQWVCWIAAYMLMSFRGFNPNQGIDVIVRMNYEDTIKALTRVANGQQALCVRQTAPEAMQPEVATSPSRGFTGPGGIDPSCIGPNTWGT